MLTSHEPKRPLRSPTKHHCISSRLLCFWHCDTARQVRAMCSLSCDAVGLVGIPPIRMPFCAGHAFPLSTRRRVWPQVVWDPSRQLCRASKAWDARGVSRPAQLSACSN